MLMMVGAVEHAAQLTADDGEALSGGSLQAQSGREHQIGVHFAIENFFQLSDGRVAREAQEESFELSRRQDFDGLQRRLQESEVGIDGDVLRLAAVQADAAAQIEHERKAIFGQARLNPQASDGDHARQRDLLAFGDENFRGECRRARQKLGIHKE